MRLGCRVGYKIADGTKLEQRATRAGTKKNKHHPKNTTEKGSLHGEPGRGGGVCGGGGKGGAEKEGSRQIARITAFDIASKFRIPKQELLLGFILEA